MNNITIISGENWTHPRSKAVYFSYLTSVFGDEKKLFDVVCDWFDKKYVSSYKKWLHDECHAWYEKYYSDIAKKEIMIELKNISLPQKFIIMFSVNKPYLGEIKIDISIFQSNIDFHGPVELEDFDVVALTGEGTNETYKGINKTEYKEVFSLALIEKACFTIKLHYYDESNFLINANSLQNALQTALS